MIWMATGSFQFAFKLFTAFAASVVALAGMADAQTLRIGTKVTPSSIDPHYHASGENSAILPHLYDALVRLDHDLNPQPGLATAWRLVSDDVWEFDLRQNVRFHDGAPFTAEDVAFTIERIPNVRNSPGSYEILTKRIARVEIVSPHRIRFHTDGTYPFLDRDLSGVMIIPRKLGLDVEARAFNAGDAAIGTGPYRFVSWAPGQQLVFTRNEEYWDGAPQWQDVFFIPISNDPTRIAALLNSEVDIIDHVPLADRAQLKTNQEISLVESPAARIMFVHLDSARTNSPFVADIHGKPLERNPLQNPSVRRALSLAIDREAIVNYLLDGAGEPASQILPAMFEGSNPALKPEKPDRARAKALLAEAGYPDGFRITLHSPSDRYPNDAKVAQALAQMWWRIGVITEVETMTRNVFFPAAARQEFSAYFSGWGETSVAMALSGLIHSYDAEKGFGQGNRARYKNETADALIEEALVTVDADRRNALLAEAQQIVFRDDQGLIPIYHPSYAWATRRNVKFDANVEGVTQAMRAEPMALH